MFGRGRQSRQPRPNELSDAAQPNSLSWGSGPDADLDASGSDAGDDSDLDGAAQDERDERDARQRAADLQAELDREAEEFGLTGTRPTAMFGPNGEAVASMLDDLEKVDRATAERIADAWEAVPPAERQVSQMIVRRLRRQRDLNNLLVSAESHIDEWLDARHPANNEEAELYAETADAMRDAVDALVLDEELADSDFAVLYGAWSEVMDEEEEGDEDEEADDDGAESSAGDEDEPEAEDEEEPEDEDDLPFGPNTPLVQDLVARLAELDDAKLAALTAAWQAQPRDELRAAHEALQALAREDPRWWAQIHDAQTAISNWSKRSSIPSGRPLAISMQALTLRRYAAPAAVDAVGALVMADMLNADEAELLYRPWAGVVGAPELPVYEDEDEDDTEEPEGPDDSRP